MPSLDRDLAEAAVRLSAAEAVRAKAALAVRRNPGSTEAVHVEQAALSALRAAETAVESLSVAIAEEAAEAAEAAKAEAVAQRAKKRQKLVEKIARVFGKWSKEMDKIEADIAVVAEAELDRDELAQKWRNANTKVELYEERIASADARADDLATQHFDLTNELEAFDKPPPTVAEALAAEASEYVATVAELEAETDAELTAVADAALVELAEPARVLPGGGHDGWRFDRGFVTHVPRRDLVRFAKEVEARKAADAAAALPRAVPYADQPWRSYQGPPAYLGRLAAVAVWARAAPPSVAPAIIAAAKARGDIEALEIIHQYIGRVSK